MQKKIQGYLTAIALMLIAAGCQKMERPELGNLIQDSNPPNSPLRFYAAMDGTGADQLRNAVDSIKANFPSSNSMTSVDGISGKAMKGADGKSIVFPSANDIAKATSFSIALWMKNNAAVGRTEFVFSLVDDKYGWHHSAIFLLVENQTPTQTTMKLGLMDQWLEGTFSKPLFDGNWHHIVYSYDQTTSKMTYYFDGAAVTGMTATQTDVKNGGSPRGPVDLTSAKKLILGGWNKHGGAQGPTDDWIKTYTGAVDQFRLYNKALSATEVQALFANKQ
ncbi:MAG: LamG domain-containing protein [Ferruginibacter sp.]|nr:LamG domain-containing protein [Ferruginibacter sp.]MBU9937292.1 LamG domain-containing protein [Ferruginibacter sp.]HQY12607.1 LamG domain-containing protein [Ferruginibacter sp.]